MFRIRKQLHTPNMIWNPAVGKPLCKFDDTGTIETDDIELADRLKEMGHEVSGEAVPDSQASHSQAGASVEDLRDYAAERGIDLGGATTAKGMLKKIIEAEKVG